MGGTCYVVLDVKKGQSVQECLKGPPESFKAKVDWDVDVVVPEGCHGTDWFIADDPIAISLSKYQNGDALVKFGSLQSKFLLRDNGAVYQQTFDQFEAVGGGITSGGDDYLIFEELKEIPTLRLDHDVHSTAKAYAANKEFYECYKDSSNLNRNLTDAQREVVERFFTAVKTTFPQGFSGMFEIKPRSVRPPIIVPR